MHCLEEFVLWLHSPYLFQQYHWLYHSSKVPHAYTAGHATFLEHLILGVICRNS